MARGDARRRQVGFKKGNTLKPKRHTANVVDPSEDLHVEFIRPTAREAHLMTQEPILKGAFEKGRILSDSQPAVKVLRSSIKMHENENASMNPKENNADSECYKLFHTSKLWEMVNAVTREHLNSHPSCDGDLHFDANCEEQRGLCWRQCVICSQCSYRSKMYNLYEEIETGKPGRKYATANVGLNIALTQTPVGATSFRKMCLASNIPAPSRSGMQKCADNVCKYILTANVDDMKARQNELKRINLFKGRPEQEVPVQADGMYNNNLYSGVGKTPYQPATQAVYIVAENVTNEHQIIACVTPNKLCAKHGFHSQDDQKACDSKNGSCTANIPIEQNIGDEKLWARQALTDLKKNGLEVSYITTDPDTAAHRAAQELYEKHVTNTLPEMQIDTRHLSECHRKLIKSDARVEKMMPGSTKADSTYKTDLHLI